MSRDLFVQDIPVAATSVVDIPDDFQPRSLPFGRDDVIAAVAALAPDANLKDPGWLRIERPGVDIEVNLTNSDDGGPLDSFALHVRGSDPDAADAFVAALFHRLGVRAFDPQGAATTGIFGCG